ncbi:MAG: hypothetical protein MZU84_05390 [Sphingobacterium sp.]|nr:hypothetical protein [Sphingobacterium sp.]
MLGVPGRLGAVALAFRHGRRSAGGGRGVAAAGGTGGGSAPGGGRTSRTGSTRRALLLGLLAGYGRLVVLGLAPFTVGDTAALHGRRLRRVPAASIHRVRGRCTVLPCCCRCWRWRPRRGSSPRPGPAGRCWPPPCCICRWPERCAIPGRCTSGVLALNGAVYLWAPLWAERYGLWQFYIVPAAVSVLVLLHLHRRELRPKVLNGARLAALSALYAGAGLDVFLRPELSVFVLALALALTGVILGIALRIRAFLYAGVAFLVLNVSGQLVRFYPEQGLSRALILIGLGAAITAGMVVFNLKREAILRRIRIARADLAAWE